MTKTKVTLELLERAIAWEPKAVREFVRILEPVFRVRIGRVLLAARNVSRDKIRDLCQETIVALIVDDSLLARSWDPSRGVSFENYAGRIAERRAIDHLRKKTEELWPDDQPCESLEPRVDSSRSPERLIETHDLTAKVFGVLQEELSESGCRIFDLLYVKNLEVLEVCAIMHVTADAVYAWRSRLGRRIEEIAFSMGGAE